MWFGNSTLHHEFVNDCVTLRKYKCKNTIDFRKLLNKEQQSNGEINKKKCLLDKATLMFLLLDNALVLGLASVPQQIGDSKRGQCHDSKGSPVSLQYKENYQKAVLEKDTRSFLTKKM